MSKVFVPVFVKDGNEFILPYKEFQNEDKLLAALTALGAIELAALNGFELLSGEPIEIDTDNFPHIPSTLGDLEIGLIAGPIFDDPKGYIEDNPDCGLSKEDE